MTKHIKEPNIIFTGNLISNGPPIFNLSNNKLIGVVGDKSKYYNHGILFNFLINDFINKDKYENIFKANNKYKYYTSLKNEINIKINVDKADINNNIYFLDNYEHEDNEGIIHLHDSLKELNELNSELYINNQKYLYKKYFIPEKEGEFNITLKFGINLTDCSYMFAGCNNIISINFPSFNTKAVKNMKYMFYECIKMKEINLFSFNTKNVIDMSFMFCYCNQLKD